MVLVERLNEGEQFLSIGLFCHCLRSDTRGQGQGLDNQDGRIDKLVPQVFPFSAIISQQLH
jgi:hypothetical protein